MFELKRGRDMIRTYSQISRTYKYPQHISIVWPIWLNVSALVYEMSGCELSGCELESRWSLLKFRYRVCFK